MNAWRSPPTLIVPATQCTGQAPPLKCVRSFAAHEVRPNDKLRNSILKNYRQADKVKQPDVSYIKAKDCRVQVDRLRYVLKGL